MRSRLLTLGALITSLHVFGQTTDKRQCGAELLKQQIIAKVPGAEAAFRQTLEQNTAEARQAMQSNSAQKTTATDAAVPVVFHVIVNSIQLNALGGIAGIEERIDSQLAVINRDFNRQNADSTEIPAGFKSVYGNAGIRFDKARRKPDGSAANGYDLTVVSQVGFEQAGTAGSGMGFSDAKFTNGTPNAWDPTKYLNIWVLSLQDNGKASNILGLTMPPSFMNYGISTLTINELGIVLSYGAFGSKSKNINYFTNNITGGRTLTHELGHYFEVWHVWGDDNGACVGSGGKDDGISDTPPQADATYNCPTYPLYDACTTTGNGIMFMNFMDYVNDGCMHMFTAEQAKVMNNQVASGKPSYNLVQHPELVQYATGVVNIANEVNALNLYPNPTTGVFTIASGSPINGLQVSDVTGALVQTIPVDKAGKTYNIDLTGRPKGIYIVHCATDNGNLIQKLVLQ